MTNIIGDIAGQYHALLNLVEEMPEGEIISVGDMVDRGHDSNRVIEFFMQPGRQAILGNHEHMMIDYLTKGGFYQYGIWEMNGGDRTLESYPNYQVPQEHIDWLKSLPKYLELEIKGKKIFVSHAFLRGYYDDLESIRYGCEFGRTINDKWETTIVWNRGEPVRRPSWDLQVCGHNSQFGLREWRDEQGLYAICLDDSRKKMLTGLHLETMEIYQVPYTY